MELKFRYRFEAAHRFVSGDSKCSTPHGHTWYATLFFHVSTPKLNEHEMISEFATLKTKWKKFIDEDVDHSFFYNEKDPLLPALRDFVPHFRGISFPGEPTTEMVAALFLKRALYLYKDAAHRPTGLLIEETPTNSLYLSTEDLPHLIERFQLPAWVTN